MKVFFALLFSLLMAIPDASAQVKPDTTANQYVDNFVTVRMLARWYQRLSKADSVTNVLLDSFRVAIAKANNPAFNLRNKDNSVKVTASIIVKDTFAFASVTNGVATLNMSSWLSSNGYNGLSIMGFNPILTGMAANEIITMEVLTESTSGATFRIKQQNTSVASILGVNVLSVASPTTLTTSNIRVRLVFAAY